MADFLQAHELTGASEGLYANIAADRGGETYRGIARKFWSNWIGWQYIDLCKKYPEFPKNIDHQGVEPLVYAFYAENFWNKISGDFIQDQDIANVVYDIAVNMGPGQAARYLQRTLNLLNRGGRDYADIPVDSVIGKTTIKALNQYIQKRKSRGKYILLFYLMVQQGGLWVKLASNSEEQEKFMNGWGSRAIDNIKHITDRYYDVT